MAARFKSCAVENCNGNSHTDAKGSRGYCLRHYSRLMRHGSPVGGRTARGAAQAFLEEAKTYSGKDCLLWPFSRNNMGYAVVKTLGNGPMRSAARVVCEAVNGMPSGNEEAAHTCGNGHLGCINPRHLRWASHSENMLDRVGHGTANRGNRHGQSKLSAADVLEIRASAVKHSYSQLSTRFGVCPQTIGQIVNRQRWTWLP
jgi:hypothetical protein